MTHSPDWDQLEEEQIKKYNSDGQTTHNIPHTIEIPAPPGSIRINGKEFPYDTGDTITITNEAPGAAPGKGFYATHITIFSDNIELPSLEALNKAGYTQDITEQHDTGGTLDTITTVLRPFTHQEQHDYDGTYRRGDGEPCPEKTPRPLSSS